MSNIQPSIFNDQPVTANQLIVPVGLNLTNSGTRTLVPCMAALAYDLQTEDLYLGDGTNWDIMQGPTGSPGNNATNFTSRWGSLSWTIAGSNGVVNLPSATAIPFNSSSLSGSGVTYPSNFLGLQVSNTGNYLVSFSISNILPSANNNMPYSFSLVINGSIGSATPSRTLQFRQDPTGSPSVIYYQEGPASLTCIVPLTTGQSITVMNTINNSFSVNFQNAVDGYTVSGTLSSIAANLSVIQIS